MYMPACYLPLIEHFCRAHPDRNQMDRRRFETAHLKYAVLRLAASFPDAPLPNGVTFNSDISVTLLNITPILFRAYQARYAGKLQ